MSAIVPPTWGCKHVWRESPAWYFVIVCDRCFRMQAHPYRWPAAASVPPPGADPTPAATRAAHDGNEEDS